MKTKTVRELRHGMLVLKIKLVRSNGTSLHVVSLHRLYRNGDLWHESSRFGQDDIPSMRYLLDQAHTWMLESASEDDDTKGH